jgi:hypothetical protein
MSIAEKTLLLKQDIDEVYTSGKQAEYDEFWDVYQNNGNRTSYLGAFSGYGWTDETFIPKYPLDMGDGITGINLFYYSRITDAIKNLGINIKAYSNMNNFANSSTITHFNTVDFSEVTQCNSAFGSSNLKRIEKLILSNKTQFSSMFGGASNIEYIGFEGTISNNGLSVSPCTKLDKSSLLKLVECLENKKGVSGTWTVTLGSTNLAKLTDDEKAIATDKGWTLA